MALFTHPPPQATKDVRQELDHKAKSAADVESEVREKLAEADDSRHHMSHLTALREPADFAKSSSNRKAALATHLVFQEKPLHTSLVDCSFVEKKDGVAMHKNILGYCGHMKMSYTPTLAREVLTQGHTSQKKFKRHWLVDEIYCQLCKHLTDNPNPRSTWLGWQLLVMVMLTFPPTPDFEKCLLHFLGEQLNKPDVSGDDDAQLVVATARACAQDAVKVLPQVVLQAKAAEEVMSLDRIKEGGFLTLPIPEPLESEASQAAAPAPAAGGSKLGNFLSAGAVTAPKKVDWGSI